MALPLLPLLASQAVRLIGTHSLRSLATKEMFNLGENVLLSKVMPALNSPLLLGSNFIPGRDSSAGRLAGNTAAGIGQMLGKTDILMDLMGKAIQVSNGMPSILNASAKISQLMRGFESSNNTEAFTGGLKLLRPSIQAALSSAPALAGLASPILDTIENLISGTETGTQQTIDSSQTGPSQQQTR